MTGFSIQPHRTSARGAMACRLVLLTAGSAIIGWSFCGTLAAAQKSGAAWQAKKNDVVKILRERSIPADQQQMFDDYFRNGFLAQFANPAARDNLPKLRGELRVFSNAGKVGEAHDQLNKLTLEKMKELLKGSDVAAKLNALLIIGQLNEQESDATTPAKPLPEAVTLLVRALAAKQDYLKVAVMTGLERHAAAGAISPADGATLTKTMLELVNQRTPPADRELEAHNWMRRSAAQVLAALGSTGPDNSVLKALLAIVSDPEARTSLRCDIAQLVGQLKYTPAAKVDFTALANAMGYLVVDACTQELDRARLDKRPPSRRLITYVLFSAGTGIKPATLDFASAAQQDLAAKLRKKLGASLQWIDKEPEDLDDETVVTELAGKITDLQSLLGPKPPTAVAADAQAKPVAPAQAVPRAGSGSKAPAREAALRAAADPQKPGAQ